MSRVVSVGLHIVDVLGRPVTEIPPGQGVAFLDEITMTVAGTAAATSVDLAKLGVDVVTVGAVGEDAMGRYLRSAMADFGIDVSHLSTREKVPTSATMLPIRPNGERPALHVIGASAALYEEDIPWDLVADADVFHLGGTFLLPGLDGEATTRILARAKSLGAITTLDFIPGGQEDAGAMLAPALRYVDYALPNLEDALFVSGTRTRADAIAWFRQHGTGCTVLTMGDEGVSVTPHVGSELRLPTHDVVVVDTTGCGDAFTAGFITGLLEGADLERCARLGLGCGSLVATGLGSDAGIVDRSHLEQFINQTPYRSFDGLADA
jgi:sugar/nucleoside kinase (ribokinase family)